MNELKHFLRELASTLLFILCLAAACLVVLAIAGCEAPDNGRLTTDNWPAILQPCDPAQNPYRDAPPADIPPAYRVSNYAGGSCNHASMQQVLRWQGLHDVAAWWRKTYSGAESAEGLARKADAKGLRFAATFNGDAGFLEWCSRTRRAAACHYGDAHAQSFLGFTADGFAVVLDNNSIDRYQRIPKAVFLARWRGWGGKAITVVYTPPPPRPWVPR